MPSEISSCSDSDLEAELAQRRRRVIQNASVVVQRRTRVLASSASAEAHTSYPSRWDEIQPRRGTYYCLQRAKYVSLFNDPPASDCRLFCPSTKRFVRTDQVDLKSFYVSTGGFSGLATAKGEGEILLPSARRLPGSIFPPAQWTLAAELRSIRNNMDSIFRIGAELPHTTVSSCWDDALCLLNTTEAVLWDMGNMQTQPVRFSFGVRGSSTSAGFVSVQDSSSCKDFLAVLYSASPSCVRALFSRGGLGSRTEMSMCELLCPEAIHIRLASATPDGVVVSPLREHPKALAATQAALGSGSPRLLRVGQFRKTEITALYGTLCGMRNGTIQSVDLRHGGRFIPYQVCRVAHRSLVTRLERLSEHHVVTRSADGEVGIWDLRVPSIIDSVSFHNSGSLSDHSFHLNRGLLVASAGEHGAFAFSVQGWLRTGKPSPVDIPVPAAVASQWDPSTTIFSMRDSKTSALHFMCSSADWNGCVGWPRPLGLGVNS